MSQKILLLCEFPQVNGGENSMLATFPALLAAGLLPVVAGPAESPLQRRVEQAGAEFVPFGTEKQGQAAGREELAALCRRITPDLLHANSLSMARLAGPVMLELPTPSIGHLRDILKLSRKAREDVAQHDLILCVSDATRQAHLNWGLAPKRIEVLHNGVDLAQFSPRPSEVTSELPRLGTVGQISLRKGMDVLAAAMEKIESPCELLVAGERHGEKEETVQVEQTILAAKKTRCIGRCETMPDFLRSLTVYVHPARQEPLGRVLLEAAATGLPIVATNVGGTAEIFPPESNAAILVEPDDPAAIATQVERLLSDVQLRNTLAHNARKRMEESFSIEHAAAGLLQHYQALLQ